MFLVLDTNIFRAHSLGGIHFAALSRISSNGYIDFRIPYIIDKEVITQKIDIIEKSFSTIENNLTKLIRNDDLYEDDSGLILHARENLSTIQERLLCSQVIDNWSNWKSCANAEVLPLSLEETNASLDAYFKGSEPYESIKVRKDIPDSFIYEQLRTLSKQSDVIFVCKDGKLKKAAAKLANVSVLEDLPQFLESTRAQEYFSAITEKQLSNNSGAIKNFLQRQVRNIQATVISIGGEKIVNAHIEFEKGYSNDAECSVYSYGGVTDVLLEFNELSYYGDGEFGLPVVYDVEASIQYFIDKAEYYSLPESETPSISDWNDYVYQAESEVTLRVKGTLKIITTVELLNEIVTGNGKIDISEFNIGVDLIDSVEVI